MKKADCEGFCGSWIFTQGDTEPGEVYGPYSMRTVSLTIGPWDAMEFGEDLVITDVTVIYDDGRAQNINVGRIEIMQQKSGAEDTWNETIVLTREGMKLIGAEYGLPEELERESSIAIDGVPADEKIGEALPILTFEDEKGEQYRISLNKTLPNFFRPQPKWTQLVNYLKAREAE